MSIASDVTRIESAKAAIKAAIEGKGVTVPDGTMLDGMAALIESIEAGGINATAGIITVATDTNDYVLSHNLGETPKFFFIAMAEQFDIFTGKTYLLIATWGWSDIASQGRTSATAAVNSASGRVDENSITDNYARLSLSVANADTITLAQFGSSMKLVGGATYYWVAVGSEVFS